MLLCAAAALQASGGQHLPGEPSRWAGQVQHGETHLLLVVQPREAGSHWRVSLPEGQPGYLQEEKWVNYDCLFYIAMLFICCYRFRYFFYGVDPNSAIMDCEAYRAL